MIVGLITARGGSKGIPRKNVALLAGKPLIAWTINASLSSIIDEVYVTTDDEEISHISKKWGAKIINRPESLAKDDSSSNDAIAHALDSLSNSLRDTDIIVLLQPTSPLRNSEHINQAIRLFSQSESNCVISVTPAEKHPFKCFIEDEYGLLNQAISSANHVSNRQSLPRAYYPNGAIYVFRVKTFTQNKSIPSSAITPYVMDADVSIDIDSFKDLANVEKLIQSSPSTSGQSNDQT